jgi:hypothetical protein
MNYGFLPVQKTAPSFVPRSHGAISSTPSSMKKLLSYYDCNSNKKTSTNAITMMPIGVPKVAYRVPGSSGADWYVLSVSK